MAADANFEPYRPMQRKARADNHSGGRCGLSAAWFAATILWALSALAYGLAACSGYARAAAEHVIHVDADGRRGGASTVATIQQALGKARQLRQQLGQGAAIVIELAAGHHRIREPVRLGAEDSGSWAQPLVIRGSTKGLAVVSGAVVLPDAGPIDGFARGRAIPEPVRARVRRYKLPPAQSAASYIELARFHAISAPPLPFELFDRNGALWPARWPDAGWTATGRVVDAVSFAAGPGVAAERLADWAQEPDLWASGHFRWDWSYESRRISRVDPRAGLITLASAPPYGLSAARRFYVAHALSELDQPGEWYRDRASGEVLVVPRPDGGAIEASIAESAFVFEGARHVRLSNLAVERLRGDGVVVNGGTGVVLQNVAVRWAAGRGVVIRASQASGVVSAHIHDTGEGGVDVEGGVFETLSPSRQFVAESRIERFSRLGRTYKPGVALAGVGARVIDNRIAESPHMAILVRGNDHEISGNEITAVAGDVTDAGAIYIGRDWTARGTVIRGNHLHAIRAGRDPVTGAPFEIKGIYLDDFASGITVEGNVFQAIEQAVFVGGGRDNRIVGNLFLGCEPAIHVDARGLTWARASVDDPASELRQALSARPVMSAIWRHRYPALAVILSDAPHVPLRNEIAGNVVAGGAAHRLQNVPEGVVDVSRDRRFAATAPESRLVGLEPHQMRVITARRGQDAGPQHRAQ